MGGHFILDLGLPDEVGKVSATASNLLQQLRDTGTLVFLRRKRLLACVLDVLTADADRFAARRAWRNYVLCLLDIARPNLVQKSLEALEPIEFTLHLLAEREAGQALPYEGILLVRDTPTSTAT